MPGVNSMQAFGPFSSDEMAIEHLRRFHPNPETWRQLYLAQGQTAMDLTEHPLLAKWIQTSSFEINRE